ncbi:MAG TPA: hypothetical protein PLY70_07095 [Saprospiraceae bacterium]|nr:hypothetical protein [Saprospiraceae bacterium]HPN70439.1 hypothetical protein [Saprospiraceae bacterium]
MLKLKFVIFCLLLAQFSFAQNYKSSQSTLVIKKTADWCPFCGSYGWDFFHGLYTDVKNNPDAILIAMHYSGGLQNATSLEITNNFNLQGQPVFLVNNADILVNSSNVNTKITQVKSTISSNGQLVSPIGVDLSLFKTGNNFTATISAKANQDLNGVNTFAGLYLVRNNLVHNQSGRNTSAVHINVLEKNLIAESTWGKPLFTGNIAKNNTTSVDVPIPSFATSADLKLLLIVWNKLPNGSYAFLNAQMINSNSITTSNVDLSIAESLSVSPSETSINVSWPGRKIDAAVLINQLGQMISLQKIEGQVNEAVFSKPSLPVGVYQISIISEGKKATKSIFLNE